MTKWKIYTPEGVQDILQDECFAKRNMEGRIRELFRSCGYFEVETPTVEFYDAFASEKDEIPQETMFKFFDQQGRILVLRPDITVPIARIAATKYKDTEGPLRFFYVGNAFKYNELGGGKQKEYTQAGVEILGTNTPEADAEVIATAIQAVMATGIESFQLDIGQVEFFKGLMEETGLSEQHTEQMRILIDHKDFLGIEELVKGYSIREELKELILSLPGLFGSTDVIEKVEKITTNERSLKALDSLRKVLEILEDYGLSRYVSVDLGMVQSLNYYSGIIFRGFTYGVGFPIVSGGRYDSLVGKFGRKCPATGFSIGINMVMMALERQKIKTDKPAVDSLVCYEKEGRRTALQICGELRRQGMAVEIDISDRKLDFSREYARRKGIGGIIHILNAQDVEVINLETGETTKTTIQLMLDRD